MAYSKEERNKHWEQIIERFFDKKKSVCLITTEDLKSIIKDKEIRLLLYFDSDKNMPDILKSEGIMLFPRTTKSWWLVKCDGLLELEPILDEPVKFKSVTQFKLYSSSGGMGEQQYVLNLINSGILSDFIKMNKKFYFSVMGKQRSKTFSITINEQELTIEGAGIEIDAGLEGEDFAMVIEAKAKIVQYISKRQLYFPYMHLRMMTKKSTIPIVFCWDPRTRTYNLWRFEIKEDNIEKINLLYSKRYILQEFGND